MYQPPQFREDRLEVQHGLMRAHPLGLLITGGAAGLTANPLPFHLDAGAGPLGVLSCHLARANPQLADLAEARECLVVFQGPQAYVTPSWYVSKQAHGKVVPTWNYVIVQARGHPRLLDDPALRRQLDAITGHQENARSQPWAVDDAPSDFIAAQQRAIVGVEIPISHLEGKWKVSQNRSAADRGGVVAGLNHEGAEAVAALVDEDPLQRR
jgi:transcriptional regulator